MDLHSRVWVYGRFVQVLESSEVNEKMVSSVVEDEKDEVECVGCLSWMGRELQRRGIICRATLETSQLTLLHS